MALIFTICTQLSPEISVLTLNDIAEQQQRWGKVTISRLHRGAGRKSQNSRIFRHFSCRCRSCHRTRRDDNAAMSSIYSTQRWNEKFSHISLDFRVTRYFRFSKFIPLNFNSHEHLPQKQIEKSPKIDSEMGKKRVEMTTCWFFMSTQLTQMHDSTHQ